MSAKECAISDMMPELQKVNKSFLAFRADLNPVMARLVREQLREQSSLSPHYQPSHTNSQLVARCFFSKSEEAVKLDDYTKYYK